jgi:putative transposase
VSRRFVSDHAGQYPVIRLCALTGVARSTYYEWRSRAPSQRDLDDAVLVTEIAEIHEASQGTYGVPRVLGQLRHRGRRVGRKRVARLMAANGLVGVHGRRKWRRGRPNTAPAADLLGGDFTSEAPDRRWVADITEFACWDGKLYVAGIKDLYDQSIVGWSMGVRQTTDLVVNALVMALGRRHPDTELVHHADRGAQYTSLEFSTRLADWGINPSFSRTGGLFRQRRDGIHLGHHQERDPPHPRELVTDDPLPAAHHPVRLHRDVLQPGPSPSPSRAPNTRRCLR